MRVEPLPGCWYLDALPSGEYAGILPLTKQVQTHFGRVPYPEDEPLWLVLTNLPVVSFMGQGHQTPFTWEWMTGTGWAPLKQSCGVWPVIYGLDGHPWIAQCAPPTGSQGWRYIAPDGTPVTGDSTIAVRHGLNEWTDLSLGQDGSILVGQGHEGEGACVWADGQLRLLHPGDCHVIRAKYSTALDLVCVCFYEVAPDGLQGWIYWLSMGELFTLPPVAAPPAPVTFHFTHAVMVRPFKAEGSGLPDLFTLGTYSEDPSPSYPPNQRLLLGHDSLADWTLPPGLRPWDLLLLEYYRTPEETLEQSVNRWWAQTLGLLNDWPGDVGCIPMMYDPFRWSLEEILAGLRALDALVNLSPRIKVIAPFAYNRANGIVKYPELQQALHDMAAACPGAPTLTPIAPVPPDHHPPPLEPPPFYPLHHPRSVMDTKIVALRGPGGKFGRPDAPNTGPWGHLNQGWRGLVWDGDAVVNDNYKFELSKPDAKHKLVNLTTRGLFGADPTNSHLAEQFYLKPDEHDRGWGESPVIYEGNISGVVAGWVEFDVDPALGKFVSCGFAVEVL